jgi:glycosyltransferase involved in cell wall biosynthesis
VGVTGRKLVYCHSPARWLHRPENYLEHFGPIPRVALRVARSRLLEWDRAAMASADVVVANSNTIAQQIGDVYGREAEVIAPSSPLMNPGVQSPIPTLEVAMNPEGFVLCVSRLLGYKHLDLLIEVARLLPHRQFVVIGDGPHETQLLDVTPRNIKWLGVVDDAELRWCYKHATTLLSTSEEDFGLTPLEAAAYGTPSVVPGARGYLDHVAEGVSGLFHDGSPLVCADVIEDAASRSWDHDEIVAYSRLFGSDIFMKQILNLVDELR